MVDDINSKSLAVLSSEAAELWQQLEESDNPDELIALLFSVQGAIEKKVDAIAYVARQLKLDIEVTRDRLTKTQTLMMQEIQTKERRLNALKNYLLHLHSIGNCPNKLVGKERTILLQSSPPRITLKVEPSELPPEFTLVKTEYKVRTSDILAAYKAGKDIEAIATVEQGIHVRFK